jgi:DNA-binding NarL/FixJ family response regulator
MPRLPRDLVKQILGDDDDVEVVGELDTPDGLVAAVRETRADFVVVGSDAGASSAAPFLDEYSRIKVLEVEADGARAFVYRLSPRRSFVGELNRESVRRALDEPELRQ